MKSLLVLFFAFLTCNSLCGDQVLSVLGDVVLVRNQQRYRVANRSELREQDLLIAPCNGGVGISMADGLFIYTGPGTRICLGKTIGLELGQIKVVSGVQDRPVIIESPHGRIVIQEGIYRIGVTNAGVRVATDRGTAQIHARQFAATQNDRFDASQAAYPPARPRIFNINRSEDVQFADGQLNSVDPRYSRIWNIPVSMLQQQGIDNAVNQNLQPGQTPTVPQSGLSDPSIAGSSQNGAITMQFGDTPRQTNQNQLTQNQGNQNQGSQRQTSNDSLSNNQRGGVNPEQQTRRRSPDASTTQFGGAGSLSFISTGAASTAGLAVSGGANYDANQGTNQGILSDLNGNPISPAATFPGNVHLITADTAYTLDGLKLSSSQADSIVATGSNRRFSIGEGNLPSSQVSTDFSTGTDAQPNAVRIPGTNNYVIELTQYGISDPAGNPGNDAAGITGLLGRNPPSPTVSGATPTNDERANFNPGATFALGEFRLGRDGDNLELAVRRSDQDRIVIKDNAGNDADDIVIPNPDVQFLDAVDPRFFPFAPTVKQPVPDTFGKAGTQFKNLNNLRRAAATTILADQLHDVARATGQTRFVIDGRIVDISGYRK